MIGKQREYGETKRTPVLTEQIRSKHVTLF